MKYSLEIGKIIEGSIRYDSKKVKNYTELLINKLKADGDDLAAQKFEKMFLNSGANFIGQANSTIPTVPIDQESKISLADIYYPTNNNFVTILNNQNLLDVEMFISSIKRSDDLNRYGIFGGNTLLLYGPPGCGKTNCAFMIAKKLNLPILVARFDSLISSYLGTTSKNIRSLFEFASRTPCVLFLDEFDAIAKARDDKNELGELKRVVNTLLQNIDSISSDTIIIAATNHPALLDPAVWRRFEYKIELNLPDQNSREKLVELFVGKSLPLSKKECSQIAACFGDKSGSYIKEFITKTIKRCIFNNLKITAYEFFDDIFKKEISSEGAISTKDKIRFLYCLNKEEKIFNFADIADILGVSKAYVSLVMKEETTNE